MPNIPNIFAWPTIHLLLILTYLEVGIAIGLLELGCSPADSSAFSRRTPFFHIVLQCIFWPLMYLVLRPASWFEKIVKLTIVACVVVYAQKYALPFLTAQMDKWAYVPLAIGGILLVLALFAFLRMPGFKPKF